MYAVIATGGKQYRVAPGDVIRVEKLEGEEGASVDFDDVLLVTDGDQVAVGTPHVEGGKVSAKINAHGRGKKIRIVKFRRRQHHRKQMGHRQDYTELTITGVSLNGKSAGAPAAAPEAKPAQIKEESTTPASESATERPAFLDGPQGEPDDLEKISGVGPVLEGKLNGLGIYHFWQIAAFTPDDITWVDNELSFKGRIERDDWLSQAKTLAAGTED